MTNAIVTFVYPSAIKYIHNFIECLSKQTHQHFELVIFNDGIPEIVDLLSKYNKTYKVVEVSGTPTQVRFEAFKWLGFSKYDKVIFQDIDDLMSTNRIACLIKLLDEYDVVANDLSLMNEEGEIYAKSIWSNKLKDLFQFDYKFIENKNILGIGNSAVQKKIFQIPIAVSSKPLVADWFMYYQILRNGNLKAVFTNQCQTYYRQHSDNMAGVKSLSEERLNYVFKVKDAQFDSLEEIGINMKEEKKLLNEQKRNLTQILSLNKHKTNFFWWDETSTFN